MRLALECAYASRLAYQPREEVEDRGWKFFESDDTQAILRSKNGRAVLAFRGTSSLEDVLDDLNIMPDFDGPLDGFVHSGFLNAFNELWPELAAEIEKLRVPLIITGHSLGGALAVLACAQLQDERFMVEELYTYGCPKVGSSEFSEIFDTPHRRYVNNNDVITRLPPGFSHTGELFYINEDGDDISTDIGFFEMALDRLKGRVNDLLEPGTDGAKDHSIDNYVAALERQCM